MNAYPEKQQYTADDLAAIIAILRDPENGCPWDKVQTHTSIRMNFLEEAYEAVDAIDLDDPELMCEELGDVLMQVVFHAQIEREAGHFTFAEVCDGVCRKLIERHPHIFGGDESIKDWDSLKNKEKGRLTLTDELESVPKVLPALMRAAKLQKRAARYGVETPAESFTIPMSRFKEMYHTMRESCLFNTHAWGKIKERIQLSQSGDVHILPSPISFPILPDIYLQEIRIEDAAAIYHAIDTHRDYLRTWLPFVDNMRTTADEEAFLRQVLSAPAELNEPIFGIWNQQHEICGLIGFHFSDFDNHRTELGYWLLPEYQHRGIITESVRKLCLWAVQEKEIKRIQIRCAVGNAASNAVPVRLGFIHEGTERCGELLASGEYTDIHIYSILKEEVLANLKR